MARTTQVEFTSRSSNAFNTQKQFDQFGFPFTLNPTVGCSFSCKYCYSPIFVAKIETGKRKQFFENIRVKLDMPALLDKQLTKLKNLPQHLKRVQINETSDYYLPQVLNELKKQKRDTMLEILNVFEKHASNGNIWMLHVLTKSNLILNHLSTYKQMREMVQIEISIATHDENIRKQIEFYTIPTKERLKVIETLSMNDIFVRAMAMPFYGDSTALIALRDEAFNRGAMAFKNKGLNYYKWEDLKNVTDYEVFIKSNIPDNEGRKDIKDETRIIKSGETVKINGDIQKKTVLMPKDDFADSKKWAAATKIETRIEGSPMEVIDCGYRDCNNVDWGYII